VLAGSRPLILDPLLGHPESARQRNMSAVTKAAPLWFQRSRWYESSVPVNWSAKSFPGLWIMEHASHLRGKEGSASRLCSRQIGTSLGGELMPIRNSHRWKSAAARIHFSRPILPSLGLRTPSKWYPKGKSLEKPICSEELAAISVEGSTVSIFDSGARTISDSYPVISFRSKEHPFCELQPSLHRQRYETRFHQQRDLSLRERE
jgi:hypothetical protein